MAKHLDIKFISELSPCAKIWLEHNAEVIFGDGRLALLEAIEETGSILQATRKLGLSYRGTWGKINLTEERLGFKLLDRQPGGRHSGTKLTEEAKALLEAYREFRLDCDKLVNELFMEHFEAFFAKNSIE